MGPHTPSILPSVVAGPLQIALRFFDLIGVYDDTGPCGYTGRISKAHKASVGRCRVFLGLTIGAFVDLAGAHVGDARGLIRLQTLFPAPACHSGRGAVVEVHQVGCPIDAERAGEVPAPAKTHVRVCLLLYLTSGMGKVLVDREANRALKVRNRDAVGGAKQDIHSALTLMHCPPASEPLSVKEFYVIRRLCCGPANDVDQAMVDAIDPARKGVAC